MNLQVKAKQRQDSLAAAPLKSMVLPNEETGLKVEESQETITLE